MSRLPQIGSFVGPYLIRALLGRGGGGAVWRVFDMATRQERALKLLTEGLNVEDRVRFEREGRIQAALHTHPNVLRVYSAGTWEGMPYLVLELAPGGSLQDRLVQGALPPEDVVSIATSVANGLAHMHAQGIVHRDLKPANVLFCARGVAKIADFGVSRDASQASLTQSGSILGTPAYMAPEQIMGIKAVGPAADVYAFGGLCYALLTGSSPVPPGLPLTAAIQSIVSTPPVPVSTLAPAADPVLAELCMDCLAKPPAERPADGTALVLRLQCSAPTRRRGRAWLALPATLLMLAPLGLTLYSTAPKETAVQDDREGARGTTLGLTASLLQDLEAALERQEAAEATRCWAALSRSNLDLAQRKRLLLAGSRAAELSYQARRDGQFELLTLGLQITARLSADEASLRPLPLTSRILAREAAANYVEDPAEDRVRPLQTSIKVLEALVAADAVAFDNEVSAVFWSVREANRSSSFQVDQDRALRLAKACLNLGAALPRKDMREVFGAAGVPASDRSWEASFLRLALADENRWGRRVWVLLEDPEVSPKLQPALLRLGTHDPRLTPGERLAMLRWSCQHVPAHSRSLRAELLRTVLRHEDTARTAEFKLAQRTLATHLANPEFMRWCGVGRKGPCTSRQIQGLLLLVELHGRLGSRESFLSTLDPEVRRYVE